MQYGNAQKSQIFGGAEKRKNFRLFVHADNGASLNGG